MKTNTKALDAIFSQLLCFADFVSRGIYHENIYLGFNPRFEIDDHSSFALFPLFAKTKFNNVFAKTDGEKKTLKGAYAFLKQHFDSSAYTQLPVYYSAEENPQKIWEIRKYGKYYVCATVANKCWASFGITTSQEVAHFWIEQKIQTYNSALTKCQIEIKRSEDRIANLKTKIIAPIKKTVENFTTAQKKLK